MLSLRMIMATVFGVMLFVMPAAAQNPFTESSEFIGDARLGADVEERALEDIVGKIIQGALSILGVLFLVYMVYGGYLWMTAQGESTTIDKAKKIIINSTIGLAIIVGAYAITAFVISKLAATGAIG